MLLRSAKVLAASPKMFCPLLPTASDVSAVGVVSCAPVVVSTPAADTLKVPLVPTLRLSAPRPQEFVRVTLVPAAGALK